MLSLRCSKTQRTELLLSGPIRECLVLWCVLYMTCPHVAYCKGQAGRGEGKPLWPFGQHLHGFKTKDLGFNSGRNQNGPKFNELQKFSQMTQCTGNVPVFLQACFRCRCSSQTLPNSFRATVVNVFAPHTHVLNWCYTVWQAY